MEQPSTEPWKQVERATLAPLFQRVTALVQTLESVCAAGTLRETRPYLNIAQTAGPQMAGVYAKARTGPRALNDLRREAVNTLLGELKVGALRATAVRQSPPPIPSTQTGRVPRPSLVLAHFEDDASPVVLRWDQAEAAPFWGIDLRFEDPNDDTIYVQCVAQNALRRLSCDLRDLHKIVAGFRSVGPDQNFHFVPPPDSERFERLITDILNEHACVATRARLREDFKEKTDLRVSYPDLVRRRGARVQVTRTHKPALLAEKLSSIYHPDELVVFSPLTLAKFIRSRGGACDAFSAEDASAVWACLTSQPTDTPSLSEALRQVLTNASEAAPDSPRGPLTHVPSALRHAIRAFVHTEALRSTAALRAREARNGYTSNIHGRRRRSTPTATATAEH